MEDEEGEVFNNTYLDELKTGIRRTSPIGRSSVRYATTHKFNYDLNYNTFFFSAQIFRATIS